MSHKFLWVQGSHGQTPGRWVPVGHISQISLGRRRRAWRGLCRPGGTQQWGQKIRKHSEGLPWWSSSLESALPLRGVWVWYPTGEPRFHVPQGAAKTNSLGKIKLWAKDLGVGSMGLLRARGRHGTWGWSPVATATCVWLLRPLKVTGLERNTVVPMRQLTQAALQSCNEDDQWDPYSWTPTPATERTPFWHEV